MKVRIKKLLDSAVIPMRAHADDAGFDLTAISVEEDRKRNCVYYHTGLAISVEHGYVGIISQPADAYKEDIAFCGASVVCGDSEEELVLRYKILQPHIHRYTTGDTVGILHIIKNENNEMD